MTRAVLLAVAAAGCAAWALGELVAAGPLRGTRTVRRSAAPGLAVLRAVGARAGVPAAPRDLRVRVAAAGLAGRVGVADVMAIKGGAALVALVLVAPLGLGASGPGGLLPVIALPAGAFLLPDRVLARRARRRAARMRAELADVLDLLRVAVEAGLPVDRAVAAVGRRHPGLLAAELRRTGEELALGVRRREAFAALAERCPVPAVAAVVAAVQRTERHGTPLVPVLAGLAADARADRARALRDAAARAAPKIQLVIALLLVPAVLLLVAAALLQALGG